MCCENARMAVICGKTSDRCFASVGERESDGYVPSDMGIGGGDYIDFMYCLNCGKIKGNWPRPKCELECQEE